MRRWIDALWPAALLVLFVGTFRTTGSESTDDRALPNCETSQTRDLATLERCLALDAQNVELMRDIGDEYLAAGTTDRAEAMYRRALAIDPHDGAVHLRLGELLLARGNAEAARTEAEAALASLPGNLTAEGLVERAVLRQGHDATSPPSGTRWRR